MMRDRAVAFQPLADYLRRLRPGSAPDGGWTQTEMAALFGVSKQAVNLWKTRGLDPWRADKVAVQLKTLPWIVWGPSWETACIADEEYRAPSVARTINNPWRWPAGYDVTEPEEMAA